MEKQATQVQTMPMDDGLEDQVRRLADGIYDPSSMAIGLNVGLAEMGLIRDIEIQAALGGWKVLIRLRPTSPGYQYFFYFQQELERRLLAQEDVVEAKVEWDEVLDWVPEDLAVSAREKIAARQRSLGHSRNEHP